MLDSLSDAICPTQEMHMNTQLLSILLIQHFKVNISLKSSKKNSYSIKRALVIDLEAFVYLNSIRQIPS